MPAFKNGKRIGDKERAVKLDGYAELESKLMHLMREEGRGIE